jgi:predicted O-methyltransferase YrrM
MSLERIREAAEIVSTVWRRALIDPVLFPDRFKRTAPNFWRASAMLFHPGIASLQVSEIPASEEKIQMLSDGWSPGGMPPQDLYALLRVVKWIKPARIFEIGTFKGITTTHLALNSDAEVYTLDLPREIAANLNGYSPGDLSLLQPRDAIGQTYRPFNKNGQIRQLFGDSRLFDYQPFLRDMDLVLVDGCHVYDGVLSDSARAFELVRERGVVLWHDFANLQEVTRAVRSLARERPIYHLEGTFLAMHVQGVQLQGELGSANPERS